ncbi:uncharacterized protein LOC134823082 [Bolinopsis microptera]|uniref:uncharacterized protein LOC134823082 n=1 Tax=Bolinopsis microptera TaxID=2820187 RepID=UPI003078C0AD
MNINPADGHIFGYAVGWATGIDIGSDDEALTKDYLSAKVWVTPANYIAIVRHQRGVVDAVKVFKFKVPGESLSTRFGLKNMNPGRQIVTQGGPIQKSIADDADNLGDDPIFSVGGAVMHAAAGRRRAGTFSHAATPIPLNADWAHDISNIQDCPNVSCKDVRLQGTDHGTGPHLKSGTVYGNYAIYVSFDSETFPLPGDKPSLKIEM